ncbi:MAG: glycosyltransferase family 2 protein [Acidobacteriota bacterium]
MTETPYLSVVIPVYNEESNVEPLHTEISSALSGLGYTHEILYIDDGSLDGTQEKLRAICAGDPHVRVIVLRRNFGQTAALSAGFNHARGQIVITMDADLQNDPSDIPKLIEKLGEGYDIVSGWRYRRKDPFLRRRVPSIMANALISLTTKVKLHDYGCTLKAFRSEVVKNIRLYGEMHRFIPAVASWMGVNVAEVKVNHRKRTSGRSKYGLGRTLRVVLDLITVKYFLSYLGRPIHIFGTIGLATSSVGVLLGAYLSYLKLICDEAIGNRPLLLLAVLLIFMGVQFITSGLLAEIQARTYHESIDKQIYVIREVIEGQRSTDS